MIDFSHQQLTTVKKMTDLELAKIEANEMHPMYEVACAEIDARTHGGHAIDAADAQSDWDDRFAEQQERLHFDHTLNYRETEDEIWGRIYEHDGDEFVDDLFVAAAGFTDPAEYLEREAQHA